MKVKYLHDTTVHNTNAASQIVPFLLNLVRPTSVIDVGCGTGTWLKVFLENGIDDVLGIEGHHLNIHSLLIPQELVELKDLEEPFSLQRKFDMLISLEVAEHLQEKTAKQFVNSLTQLSDVIVFSAAIPFQGGQNHINEQWTNYWTGLFELSNYTIYDIIRPAFWNNQAVEFWYKQNSFIAVHQSVKDNFSLAEMPTFNMNSMIHPDLYLKKASYLQKILQGKDGLVAAGRRLIKTIIPNN